ncbi:MAG: hypothetical protein ACKO8I_03495 [Cyanobacteriota bacterium]
MTDSLRTRLRTGLHRALRDGRLGPLPLTPLTWAARADRDQWQALAAYRGLVHQAFAGRPLAPQVCTDLWENGVFRSSADREAFFSPALRELENSSHHYGHDVQLKRHAGLPLIGPPLPWLLEHGLKVSRMASFERPRPWSRGYLCMGPLRAKWLEERFGLPAVPIGPWILYARPLLDATEIERLRADLGRTLLVVLAHSWDQVERRMDRRICVDAVAALAATEGYRSVIWLRHWQDPAVEGLPLHWIVACNGHRSNPWFLDAMHTLLSLSDGLATNAFGTHLGYGVALGLRVHWVLVDVEQDLSRMSTEKAAEEREEWQNRQRLSAEVVAALRHDQSGSDCPPNSQQALRQLLDPFWGFDCMKAPSALAALLRRAPRIGAISAGG